MKKIIATSDRIFLISLVETDSSNTDCIYGRSLHLTTVNGFFITSPLRVILKKDVKSFEVPSSDEINFFNFIDSQEGKEVSRTKKILEEFNLLGYFS